MPTGCHWGLIEITILYPGMVEQQVSNLVNELIFQCDKHKLMAQ